MDFRIFQLFNQFPHCLKKKGMSSEIIPVPFMDALVMGLWDGHPISMLLVRCKNLWAKICEKIVKKSEIFTKKLL